MLNVTEETCDMNIRDLTRKNEREGEEISDLAKNLEDSKAQKQQIDNQIRDVEKDIRFQISLLTTKNLYSSQTIFPENQITAIFSKNDSTKFYDTDMGYSREHCMDDSRMLEKQGPRRSSKIMIGNTAKQTKSKKRSINADLELHQKKKTFFCC